MLQQACCARTIFMNFDFGGDAQSISHLCDGRRGGAGAGIVRISLATITEYNQ